MRYDLGVDLGTTFTAAAIVRDGRAETVSLAPASVAVPTVAYLNDEGELLFGPVAARRTGSAPSRVAQEFKRRVGDPTPILLGGTPVAAEMLMARMLAWVVERVSETEGEPPARLAVTHPANWNTYKLDLLEQAARHVGLSIDKMIAEPVAAARFYVHNRAAVRERLAQGSALVVYDLGGGTFDAAVVKASDQGELTIVGRPDGVDRLGGIDVDHATLGHVTSSLGIDPETADPEDPTFATAWAQLRNSCTAAKEALSDETSTTIPVLLPDLHHEVRLTRSELENMIRPTLSETLVALRRTITSAGVPPADIDAVLLVGGSSRIPLVGELVAAEVQRPIAIDARPKDAICHGAALSLSADAADAGGTSGAGGAASAAGAVGAGALGAGAAGAPGAGAAASEAGSGDDLPPTPPSGTPPLVDGAGAGAVSGGGDTYVPTTAQAPIPVAVSGPAVHAAPGVRRGFNPLWAAAAIVALAALTLVMVTLINDDSSDPGQSETSGGASPSTQAVAADSTTTTAAPTTTTTTTPTTTTTSSTSTTTTSTTTTTAPAPDELLRLTVNGSFERWGGSCYYDSLGTSRPVTAEPAAACRDGRGPSYYIRAAAHGSFENGVCWERSIDIGNDLGNRSDVWIQLQGGGWMSELYFNNGGTITSNLPPC